MSWLINVPTLVAAQNHSIRGVRLHKFAVGQTDVDYLHMIFRRKLLIYAEAAQEYALKDLVMWIMGSKGFNLDNQDSLLQKPILSSNFRYTVYL